MSEITAIVSGKGGAGKTMFAANMACMLAMQGRRVLLIDTNTGLRNLDICMGMENQVIFDLSDIVNGICQISKALIPDRRFDSLYLLSASQTYGKADIKAAHMKRLYEKLSTRFDNIIVDTASSLGRDWEANVSSADSAVIMLTQEFASVRGADTMDSILRSRGVRKRCAVVNKVSSEYSGNDAFPSLKEISGLLRVPVAGAVQLDSNIHISMNKGVPVVCRKDSYINRNFRNMCERIFGIECEE